MKIDLYSMANYQVMHPLKLKNLSKKQKSSFKKNYFSLGFDPGFTKPLLSQLHSVDVEEGKNSNNLLSSSLILKNDKNVKKK
jgi:hypothetical protein